MNSGTGLTKRRYDVFKCGLLPRRQDHGRSSPRPSLCTGFSDTLLAPVTHTIWLFQRPTCCPNQASMLAYLALSSMNFRRGGTSSPIDIENTWSAPAAAFNRHLTQGPVFRIESGFPKLLGIHLTQTLVALDVDATFAAAFAFEFGNEAVAFVVVPSINGTLSFLTW